MDTYRLYTQLEGSLSETAARTIADAMGSLYAELHEALTKADLTELRQSIETSSQAQAASDVRLDRLAQSIAELTAAQRGTDERVGQLAQSVQELAAAQRGTDERLGRLAAAQERTETELSKRLDSLTVQTEQRLGELAAAQQRTEARFDQLAAAQDQTEKRLGELAAAQQQTEQCMRELAAAQQQTEKRMSELAAAQQQTEKRMSELAAAQQSTETQVSALTAAMDGFRNDQQQLRRTVGGLSDSVGYGLEDRAIARLPALLASDYAIAVSGGLARRFIEYPDGGSDELNIIGEGTRAQQDISILGEAKAQLGKRDVDRFLRLIDRLEKHGQLRDARFLFAVSYSTQPDVARYAEQHGVVVIPSYLLGG